MLCTRFSLSLFLSAVPKNYITKYTILNVNYLKQVTKKKMFPQILRCLFSIGVTGLLL